MVARLTVSLFGLAAGVASVAAETVNIDIPSDLATRVLLPDVYGYSIEPIWVDSFTSTSKASKLLQTIANMTGKPPPIRVGGNTADATYQLDTLSTGNFSVALPGLPNAKMFNVTPEWYGTWGDYFPKGTDLIYTLNLAVNTSGFENALKQAEAAHAALGDRLVMFELGNEIDHYIAKGWRDSTWGVAAYLDQFRNLTGQIVNSDWYKQAAQSGGGGGGGGGSGLVGGNTTTGGGSAPKFQAGVFADPPWVPDQQDQLDDFDIVNITQAGIAQTEAQGGGEGGESIIGSYAMHLYPQSTCDTARWHRMRLDLVSDHAVLWRNLSQYVPQVAAADMAGSPLVMGETNSVSCGGRSGISDTFGAALWGVDYVLTAASIGIEKIYFHLGGNSEYSSFTPAGYPYKNETLEAGIRPGWYAHYFLAHVVRQIGGGSSSSSSSGGNNERFAVAGLPSANSSSLSGFAVYASPSTGDSDSNTTTTTSTSSKNKILRKLVILDMGVWNGTEGLSNPSTLSATDGTMFSEGQRPTSRFRIAGTTWCPGRNATVTRLEGPGTNAKSGVAVSGVTFDPLSGDVAGGDGTARDESVAVGEGGVVELDIVRAQAVLLEMSDMSPCQGGSGSGAGTGGGAGTGAAGRAGLTAGYWAVSVLSGAAVVMLL
ncbi:glycosyl hydrolase family protein [Microdochium nivale]|nr:glycosyl hydrolase family protein [Microdochium nivale]